MEKAPASNSSVCMSGMSEAWTGHFDSAAGDGVLLVTSESSKRTQGNCSKAYSSKFYTECTENNNEASIFFNTSSIRCYLRMDKIVPSAC
jgi:hypothetical protein